MLMNVSKIWECKGIDVFLRMQNFGRKILGFIALSLLLGTGAAAQQTAVDASSTLLSGDKAFEEGRYTEAMEDYEQVYAQGQYSEAMLYRLAYMHENLRNYPEGIYYLKKAAQEYGDKGTDAKIRQLMQRQGSTRFFTGDNWNQYLGFFRSWGWAFYLAFGLALAALSAHYLLPNKRRPSWRQLSAVAAWTVFLAAGALLFHRNFMAPKRAVLMEETAFYEEPGFASAYRMGAFSLGETVDIEGTSDIWLQVSAGGREWWVPKWVVREL